jgi:hypothetical protein
MTRTQDSNSPFGEVIFSYTRAQSIADGVLVDVSDLAREAGFRWPVALTAAAWEDCVAWETSDTRRQCHQDVTGRLWDVLFLAAHAARVARPDTSRHAFEVTRVPRDGSSTRAETAVLHLHLGPGDTGEPVITILQPHED